MGCHTANPGDHGHGALHGLEGGGGDLKAFHVGQQSTLPGRAEHDQTVDASIRVVRGKPLHAVEIDLTVMQRRDHRQP